MDGQEGFEATLRGETAEPDRQPRIVGHRYRQWSMAGRAFPSRLRVARVLWQDPHVPLVLVEDLRLAEYGKVWDLQHRLVQARLQDRIDDTLLLVEHPHVFTLGRRGKRDDVFDASIPVFEIERGGEATYHGPGQLVGYPIVKLGEKLEVKRFVTALQGLLIEVAKQFGVPAEPGPQTGVWVGTRKLASIGVAVNRNVTYHGFALNVNTDLSYFLKCRPCGSGGEVMTSLEKELGHPVEMVAVKRAVAERSPEVEAAAFAHLAPPH